MKLSSHDKLRMNQTREIIFKIKGRGRINEAEVPIMSGSNT